MQIVGVFTLLGVAAGVVKHGVKGSTKRGVSAERGQVMNQ